MSEARGFLNGIYNGMVYKLGFDYHVYLTKTFKANTRVSPNAYRGN